MIKKLNGENTRVVSIFPCQRDSIVIKSNQKQWMEIIYQMPKKYLNL